MYKKFKAPFCLNFDHFLRQCQVSRLGIIHFVFSFCVLCSLFFGVFFLTLYIFFVCTKNELLKYIDQTIYLSVFQISPRLNYLAVALQSFFWIKNYKIFSIIAWKNMRGKNLDRLQTENNSKNAQKTDKLVLFSKKKLRRRKERTFGSQMSKNKWK